MKLAKVVEVHPEDNSVDLLFLHNGARLVGVQVMTSAGSTDTGLVDLASPDLSDPSNKWAARDAKTRDVVAVVGYYDGLPVVLGFLFPQVSQMLFAEKNRRIMRHASDVYTSIDNEGNTEVSHPSGTYLRIGTSPDHEDLTGKDFDKKWKITKNTTKAVHVQLSVKNAGAQVASLNIDPGGNVTLTHSGNMAVNTAGNADVTVGGSTTVTSGGPATMNAPEVTVNAEQSTFNGKVTVNGLFSFTAGMAGQSGGAGAAATLTGGLENTGGSVSSNGVVLDTHGHIEQGDGARVSNPVS